MLSMCSSDCLWKEFRSPGLQKKRKLDVVSGHYVQIAEKRSILCKMGFAHLFSLWRIKLSMELITA